MHNCIDSRPFKCRTDGSHLLLNPYRSLITSLDETGWRFVRKTQVTGERLRARVHSRQPLGGSKVGDLQDAAVGVHQHVIPLMETQQPSTAEFNAKLVCLLHN